MKSITVSELRENLSEVLAEARHGEQRFAITSHGRVVGAVIGPEDLEDLEARDRADVEAARKALAEPGEGIPYEAARKELGL